MNILDKAKQTESIYYQEFKKIMSFFKNLLSEKEYKSLKKKYKIKDKDQNLQYLTELSISFYFAKKFPENFVYEKKSKISKKDVDCSLQLDDFTCNIEIKCPKFSYKHSDNPLYFKTFGKVANNEYVKTKRILEEIKDSLNSIADIKTPSEVGGAPSKHERLYEYLKDFQEKVGEYNSNSLNILVVSLYNLDALSEWSEYLFMTGGLFKENTAFNKETFDNIDIIMFTSSVNSHYNFDNTLVNPWMLEEQFNFLHINPNSKKEYIYIQKFLEEIFPHHYTKEIFDFLVELNKNYTNDLEKLFNNFLANSIIKNYDNLYVLRTEYLVKKIMEVKIFGQPYFNYINWFNKFVINATNPNWDILDDYNMKKLFYQANMKIMNFYYERMIVPKLFYDKQNLKLLSNEEDYYYAKL